VRQQAIFAAWAAAIILLVTLILEQVFAGADGHRAVLVSAAVAFVVQIAAFAAITGLRGWNVMGAWGVGVGIRFVALALYALVGIKVWALAPVPALLTLVICFFLSTLAEPWLLRSPAPSR
jgi:hypothetical protein